MTFPISGAHADPVLLVIVGFIVGVAGGFFGVGGSFLAGPALYALGLPMNYVIGTDLCHLTGKSLVAVRRHLTIGHVDVKLGCLMMIGTVPGVEIGARFIEYLKQRGDVSSVVATIFASALIFISAFMLWEVCRTLKARKHPSASRRDEPSKMAIASALQKLPLGPYIRLPASGIERISFWAIFLVSLVSGIFSGFLGGGAGYVRMPSMVYLLGVPTHVAVGTDLLEVIVSAGYGTLSHAVKGNVDVLVALVMHTGAAVGAQFGALLTQYVKGVWIRVAFIPLPVIGAILLVYRLLRG